MKLPCGCPDQIPDWHRQDVDLGGHFAHIMPIPLFLHMPIGYESYVLRQQHAITQLGLNEQWPGLVLTRSAAFRGRIIRLLQAATSPARHLEFLPSPFRLRGYLHQGGVGSIAPHIRQMQSDLIDAGRRPRELYLSYLTCSQCSEQRGGDQVLLLRRWDESATLKDRLARQAASRR